MPFLHTATAPAKTTKPKQHFTDAPEHFASRATTLHLTCQETGEVVVLKPYQFASGSLGWYASKQLTLPYGSDTVRCQCNFQSVVNGSKPQPKPDEQPESSAVVE